MGSSCKDHDNDDCACRSWGKWRDNRALGVAIALSILPMFLAIFGYAGYIATIVSNNGPVVAGKALSLVRTQVAVLTVWSLGLIFGTIAMAYLVRHRNMCLHSCEAMKTWRRVTYSAILVIYILMFTIILNDFVAPLVAALVLLAALFVNFKYIGHNFFKTKQWVGFFWVIAILATVVLFLYTASSIVRR
jgi:hypothetical protein